MPIPLREVNGQNDFCSRRRLPLLAALDKAQFVWLETGRLLPTAKVAGANAINDIKYQSIQENTEYAGRIFVYRTQPRYRRSLEMRVNANNLPELLCAITLLPSVVANAADRRQDVPQLLVAAASAYSEFEIIIYSKRSDGELGAFFSDIRNYEIVLSVNGSTCIAEFRPRPFNGSLVRGGGARYVVDLKSGNILSTERFR